MKWLFQFVLMSAGVGAVIVGLTACLAVFLQETVLQQNVAANLGIAAFVFALLCAVGLLTMRIEELIELLRLDR